jgi:hypothetical protein
MMLDTGTPERPWHEVALSYGMKIAAAITMLAGGVGVGLVIYYAL